jgi:hypothetical protein
MKTVLIFVGTIFVGLGVAYVLTGGRFDAQFWQQFLPGLMENLLILALAILVIDRIFRKERLSSLRRANSGQSRFVLLQCNLLAFKMLAYLGHLSLENRPEDKELMFSFAMEKMNSVNVAESFYQSFMAAADRSAYLLGFTKILTDGADGLSKAVDKIYPYPSPTVKHIVEEIPRSVGMVDAIEMLLKASREANELVAANERLQPEQIDLLLKIGFVPSGTAIERVRHDLIQLAGLAEADDLFLVLD